MTRLSPLGLSRRGRPAGKTPPGPKPKPPKKHWTEAEPFHVGTRHINGTFVGYDIYVKNRLFLRQAAGADTGATADSNDLTPRLKRHEAYAIARLLNAEQAMRKWADRFGDPYA